MTDQNPDNGVLILSPGMGREKYASWLRVGLDRFFFESKGALALLGLGDCYGRNPFIGDDIAEAVGRLPSSDRSDFREASILVLRETAFDSSPGYVEALLAVLAGLKATNALEVIAQKIHTLKSHENAYLIFRYCFEFTRDISLIAGKDAVQCLRHICAHPSFPQSFAGQALEAMTAADPTGFNSHFRHLQKHLDANYDPPVATYRELMLLRKRRGILIRRLKKFNVSLEALSSVEARDLGDDAVSRPYWWQEALVDEVDFGVITELLPLRPVTEPPPADLVMASMSEHEEHGLEGELPLSEIDSALGHAPKQTSVDRLVEQEYADAA